MAHLNVQIPVELKGRLDGLADDRFISLARLTADLLTDALARVDAERE